MNNRSEAKTWFKILSKKCGGITRHEWDILVTALGVYHGCSRGKLRIMPSMKGYFSVSWQEAMRGGAYYAKA